MAQDAQIKALVDFDCLDCVHTVQFDLMSLHDAKGTVSCPHCHRPYQFDRHFLAQLEKLRNLVLAVREAEEIIGNCQIAVTVPGGEVKIPYRLLLTRMNTLISLEVSGKAMDFNFRIEPLNDAAFR